MTTNVAALTSVVSSTLGSPLIKAAAFSYGVRKTVQDRRDADAVRDARRKHRAERREGTLMRRLFWLAMGITIGALIVRKLSNAAAKLTPGGMAGSLGAGAVRSRRLAARLLRRRARGDARARGRAARRHRPRRGAGRKTVTTDR